MIVPNKFNGYNRDGTRNLFLGGGGGGGQTTSTVQNTNIPPYAQPYVESMLGATINQLFNTTETGGTAAVAPTYDDQGNQLTAGTAAIPGTINIDTFKPYQAYGGTYAKAGDFIIGANGEPLLNPDGTKKTYKGGEQLSYDPTKGIAGYSDLQKQAQGSIAGMGLDPAFARADTLAQQAGLGATASADKAYGYGTQGSLAGQKGQELGIAGGQKYGELGAGYGAQGAGYGSQAAGLADTALGYGKRASTIGEMALDAQDTGNEIGTLARGYAGQAAGAGDAYAKQATSDAAMKQYMSPYMKNVVEEQNKEAQRQSKIAGTQQQAEATRAGAFGGGRDAIMRAERERNLATLMNQNTAQGQQAAFQQAQQAQQFGAGLGLQGLQGAQQGLGTALQGGQLGLSGLGTALQGQQGALSGVGAANQAYQTGIQGSQAGIAGAGMGLQGVDRQLAGTAQGMQGAQIGLQGVQGAQAGYGLANQTASNMSNIAGQRTGAELSVYSAQNAIGGQMQDYEQRIKDQAVQDYANAQQYPLMQLGTMSNMLRGLPMQASTTNQYAAAPRAATQAIGAIGAGANIYSAMKPGGAAGGLPSEFKYAKGGIASVPRYDMGGEVESQLENMDEKGLQAQARESSSPSIRRMAQRLLRERQMSKPQGADAANVQYQAAQPQMPSYKPGGIVAFATGDTVYGGPSSEEGGEEKAKGIDLAGRTMEQRLAMAAPSTPPAGGIMGASPVTQVPVAPAGPSPDVVKEAMRQRDLNTVQANRSTADVIKEIQAERDASGIGDNKAREEYRSQQMAERANMKDEQERQRHMRLAEFFASWGSTPGPVLVAGMNALKQSIPGLITDQKEAKKARREADKIIYDIDESTRLDKQGMHNEATARREKAAKYAEEYNKYLLTFESQRQSDKRALEVAGIQAKAQTDAAGMRNASDRASSVAANKRADEATRNNFQRYALDTKRAAEKLETDIAKEAKDSMEYANAKRQVNITKQSKEQRAKAEATIKEYETGWATRRQAVKDDQDLAKEQLKEINQRLGYGKKPDNTGGGGAAADRPSIASFQR